MRAGWLTSALGEVCNFTRGLTYGKADEVPTSNNIVLRAHNIDLPSFSLDLTDLRYIRNEFEIPDEKRIRKGALLVCTASGSRNHLGKVALLDIDARYAFGGFMGLIEPKKNVECRFLHYCMMSDRYRDFIDSLSDGVNINNLKFDDLARYQVPVPPLLEQRRIVRILDEAFAAIAAAKANAEKNLQNARAVFDAHLHSLFINKRTGWAEVPLEQLCKFSSGGTPAKDRADFWRGEIPWVSGRDMKSSKLTDTHLHISQSAVDESATRIAPAGTLL